MEALFTNPGGTNIETRLDAIMETFDAALCAHAFDWCNQALVLLARYPLQADTDDIDIAVSILTITGAASSHLSHREHAIQKLRNTLQERYSEAEIDQALWGL